MIEASIGCIFIMHVAQLGRYEAGMLLCAHLDQPIIRERFLHLICNMITAWFFCFGNEIWCFFHTVMTIKSHHSRSLGLGGMSPTSAIEIRLIVTPSGREIPFHGLK